MRILYSFNKTGFEATYWDRELRAASRQGFELLTFNHGDFLSPERYLRAQQLDNLYEARDPGLERMYAALEDRLRDERPDVLLVDNCHPYHPEFLRTLDIYKVIRTTDGPVTAYDRDFAYLHAYDHVLYHSPAYSRDLTMAEKLAYCGAKRADFWPLAVFDAFCRPQDSEDDVFGTHRDIDVIYVGSLHPAKMAFLAQIRRAFGRRFRIYGVTNLKRNAYFVLHHGAATWVRPVRFEDYVPLYRRARIGINTHLRGKYTVGNYRMFDLPANGVLQISDGSEYLAHFYEPGREIVGYESAEEAIGHIDRLLSHPSEREAIARAGYRRAMNQHRIGSRLRELETLLAPALGR